MDHATLLELTALARAGDVAARNRVVEANMGLVCRVARMIARGRCAAHDRRDSMLPVQDMIQEGAIGLMRAAERYDPAMGFAFSTYATKVIWSRILHAMRTAPIVLIPVRAGKDARRIRKWARASGTMYPEAAAALGLAGGRLACAMAALDLMGPEVLTLEFVGLPSHRDDPAMAPFVESVA